MAELVLGIGTSHGPLLNTPPDQWGLRASADRSNEALAYRGATHNFEELLEARSPGFHSECRPEVMASRHSRSRDAIAELGEIVRGHDLDVLVVVSSDHKEIFDDENLPQFAMYWGDEVDHVPFTRAELDSMAPGLAIAEVANVPDAPSTLPCNADLALHLLRATSAAGFDPAASRRLPAGRFGNHGIPHGWGFVMQQVLGGHDPIPLVPLFVNTFWQPNPPSAARCVAFGAALGAAIESYPIALRVGLVASGGLSHMVIDEDLDHRFLQALLDDDTEYLASLPDDWLVSGTSEMRNWIVVAAAMARSRRRARVIDYQPCYRSEAGTGCAMGFVAWDEGEAT